MRAKFLLFLLSMVIGLSAGTKTGEIEYFSLIGDGGGFRPTIKLKSDDGGHNFSDKYLPSDNFKMLTALISVALSTGKQVEIFWDDNTNEIKKIKILN